MDAKATAAPHAGRWLSIRPAAELLGVNQATLRHWGNSGKVRTFTTPGGHRRFLEDDLVALTEADRPAEQRGPVLAEILLSSRERYESIARRRLGDTVWFRSFDDLARRRFRILGGSMLSHIANYLAGSRRERERSLHEAREVATEHGAETARLGLSLSEATEAFLLFRTPILESISRWVRERQPAQREADELLRRANHFMDQVLVTMAGSHEAYRAANPREVGP